MSRARQKPAKHERSNHPSFVEGRGTHHHLEVLYVEPAVPVIAAAHRVRSLAVAEAANVQVSAIPTGYCRVLVVHIHAKGGLHALELVHDVGEGRTHLGVLCPALAGELDDLNADAGRELWPDILMEHIVRNGDRRLPHEHPLAGENLEQHDAEGVDVCGLGEHPLQISFIDESDRGAPP